MKLIYSLLSLSILLAGCADSSANSNSSSSAESTSEEVKETRTYVKDVHSFAQPEEIAVDHISLEMDLDFESNTITGIASHNLVHNSPAEEVSFDVRNMTITGVTLDGGAKAEYREEKGNEFGDALYVKVGAETRTVDIHYVTNPSSQAVQWLSPVQTSGKKHPFLFTQGQAILTRTWIPCQDSPGIRVTYDAKVKVPADLMAVMSADNPKEKNATGEYRFEMKQAIPPYLIALAAGDIAFKAVGDRSGVYAEHDMLDKSAEELSGMEDMIVAAEGLYGAYAWDQYDVIVLPPSFPFGGMENPRLTFATPTIIAGDKSLVSLIAHELAHSWSGNLVTNATWDDFWLNEGFTVYFEYRIMEEVYGKEYADMLKTLGLQDLKQTIEDIGHTHADTHLKLELTDRDPDMGMTDIAYEKGHMFLEMLESTYGRETFDAFLKEYFNNFKFQNMTTERFLSYLDEELVAKHDHEVNVDEWVYGPGLPSNSPEITSNRFKTVDAKREEWLAGKLALSSFPSSDWTTQEWLHFLRAIPNDLSVTKMGELDAAFALTASGNAEIQDVWYEKSIYTGYEKAFPAMEEFLINVGRRKFLTPLYSAMIKDDKYREMALRIYEKARSNYHSVSTGSLDELLEVNQ